MGFTWSAEDEVLLRARVDPETCTVSDLVAIDALRASMANGTCVLTKRAYLPPFLFGAFHEVCIAEGFSCRGGWVKAMGDGPSRRWRRLPRPLALARLDSTTAVDACRSGRFHRARACHLGGPRRRLSRNVCSRAPWWGPF